MLKLKEHFRHCSMPVLFTGIIGILLIFSVLVMAESRSYPVLTQIGDSSKIPDVSRDKVICFALYTVQKCVLKLTAQLYPLQSDEEHRVYLEALNQNTWKRIAAADVHSVSWTATFRIEHWDTTRDIKYRVVHAGGSTFEGLIRRDPVDKHTIVAAAFTGNSPGPGGGKISKQDVVDNIKKVNPDVLLFTGDQVYNHNNHTEHWLLFGEIFKDIIRDRPTVCLPDDHDVGQGNLWGGNGRKVDIDTKGGYTRPAEYVKLVERQQTSHMPDSYDPTPIEQGIGVYYTSLNIGGIDFAIIEDRKFKSGCFDFNIVKKGLGPRPDHINKPSYDPRAFDVPGKKLLDRQLQFLEQWSKDWDGVVMKAVVSQTLWSMVSTYHSSNKTFYYADFDANGWPQTARDKAIDRIRRCFAFHICGDQHLSSIVQYDIDRWRDSGWAFCVPSIANLWPRWWIPKQQGLNPEPGAQEYTGDFLDGFGNKVTVYAHTNPYKTGREPAELHDRMPGFGIVRFDKNTRKITMECWPRMVDPTDPSSQQYPGWPRVIHQYDNYPREAVTYLPTIVVEGQTDPLVQIIDQLAGEIVYAVRIQGSSFKPKVFCVGLYTIKVGHGSRQKVFKDVPTVAVDGTTTLKVKLSD